MAHVWVIEVEMSSGRWMPTGETEDDGDDISAWRTKAKAGENANDLTDFCDDEVNFRVAKYTREETK